jgi:hypothetical protein
MEIKSTSSTTLAVEKDNAHQFLLDKYTGETPGNYYALFKWVVNVQPGQMLN